jgi:hypothetical protein
MFYSKWSALILLITVIASKGAFGQGQVAAKPNLPMKALVIGNQQYGENINSLKNPVNDANLMASTLTKIGFEVETKLNLTHEQMDDAIAQFSRGLEPGSVSFIYYAGHGIRDNSGRNYLIPVDAKLPTEKSMKYQTVPLDYIVDSLESSPSSFRIVVLDCCRDNPFSKVSGRNSNMVGLSKVVAPDATLIAYSTKEGMTASDGEGANSLYTEKLAQSLEASARFGRSIVQAFRDASQVVGKQTNQKPYLTFDATMPDFFFTSGANPESMANANALEALSKETSEKKPILEPKSPNRMPEISARFAKVDEFKRKKELRQAINEYTLIIADSLATREDQRQARLGRGVLLSSLKENKSDIIEALKDYLAAGEKSLELELQADNADLVVNNNTAGSSSTNQIRGRISQGDRVKMTNVNGNWVWVSEVVGKESQSGWVEASKFAKVPPATPKSEISERTSVNPTITSPNSSLQQPNIQRTARPPRPRGAWETPEWEPAWKAQQMRRAQEEWDRLYGRG